MTDPYHWAGVNPHPQPQETPMQSANKAYIAFALAFATALLAQVADKTEFNDLTVLQWLIAVVSAAVTAGGVYVLPNRPA